MCVLFWLNFGFAVFDTVLLCTWPKTRFRIFGSSGKDPLSQNVESSSFPCFKNINHFLRYARVSNTYFNR